MNRRRFFKGFSAVVASISSIGCKPSNCDKKTKKANLIIKNPITPFTMAQSFRSCANGLIFIGKPYTNPKLTKNQIPVYATTTNGDSIQVEQPLIINAAGYPTYHGQIANFTTTQNYSMAVYSNNLIRQFFWDNISILDESIIRTDYGYDYIGKVKSFAMLRKLEPEREGQRILLTSWNEDISPYGQSSFGGGEFIAMRGNIKDDGGFNAKVTDNWYWMRVKDSSEATIKDFGAVPDGVTLCDNALERMFIWAYGSDPQSNIDTLSKTAKQNIGMIHFGHGNFAISNVDLRHHGRKQCIKFYGDLTGDYKNLRTTLFFTANNGYAINAMFLQAEMAGFNLIGKNISDQSDNCGFLNNQYAQAPQTFRARAFHIQFVGGIIFNLTDTQDTEISQIYMEGGSSTLVYAKWSGNSVGKWDHNTAIALRDISIWKIKKNSAIFIPRCHQSEIQNVWISDCEKPGNISQGDWKFTGVFQLEGNQEDFFAQETRIVGNKPGTQGKFGISYTLGNSEIPNEWDENPMGVPSYVLDPSWERGRTYHSPSGVEVSYGAVQTCFYASRNAIRYHGADPKWYKLGDVYLPSIGQGCEFNIIGTGGYETAENQIQHTHDLSFGNGKAIIEVQNKDEGKLQVTWHGQGASAISDVKYTGSNSMITIYIQVKSYSPSLSVFLYTDAQARSDAGIHFKFDYSGMNIEDINSIKDIKNSRAKWMISNGTGTGGIGVDMDYGSLILGVNLQNVSHKNIHAQAVPVYINGTLYYLPLIKDS